MVVTEILLRGDFCHHKDSNPGPPDLFKSTALPIELKGNPDSPVSNMQLYNYSMINTSKDK